MTEVSNRFHHENDHRANILCSRNDYVITIFICSYILQLHTIFASALHPLAGVENHLNPNQPSGFIAPHWPESPLQPPAEMPQCKQRLQLLATHPFRIFLERSSFGTWVFAILQCFLLEFYTSQLTSPSSWFRFPSRAVHAFFQSRFGLMCLARGRNVCRNIVARSITCLVHLRQGLFVSSRSIHQKFGHGTWGRSATTFCMQEWWCLWCMAALTPRSQSPKLTIDGFSVVRFKTSSVKDV